MGCLVSYSGDIGPNQQEISAEQTVYGPATNCFVSDLAASSSQQRIAVPPSASFIGLPAMFA